MLRPLILFALLVIMGASCGRAPAPTPVKNSLSKEALAGINDLLDAPKDHPGPKLVCIHLSKADNILSAVMNERPMTKEQLEIAIEKLAAIDPGQTLVIEFDNGAERKDLESIPSINHFDLIGRLGKDRESLWVIK